MIKNKILSGTVIAAIATILLAWAPSAAYAGNDVHPGILDIKPGSCPNPVNLGSNGVIPIAILGSDTLDVTDIVTTGYESAGLKFAYEDVGTPFDGEFTTRDSCSEAGPDGYLDLTIKVPADSFLLLCVLDDKSVAILGLEFNLLDGTSVTAWDIVSVLKKNNNHCL